MKYLICAAASLAFTVAHADQQGIERAQGIAAASVVMVPVEFQRQCEDAAKNTAERLHCIARIPAIDGGANFMHDLRAHEIKNGRDLRAHVFVTVKQYAEKVYDVCMVRHSDEIEQSGSFAIADSLCKLEKSDAYTGMTAFDQLFQESLKRETR